MARTVVVAVLAALLLTVAAPASADFDQPRRHGPALSAPRPVGPTPPFGGALPPLFDGALPLPRCARETMARVEALAGLLRSLPLGGVLVALADPTGVCAAPAQ